MTRSLQSLLLERRANVIEMSGERDITARAMLAAHVIYLDQLIRDFGELGWESEVTKVAS